MTNLLLDSANYCFFGNHIQDMSTRSILRVSLGIDESHIG